MLILHMNNDVLFVSVVTPTFNSIRTIDEYMKALAGQDYPHEKMELIIADGGSTDGTLEQLSSFNDVYDIP